MKLTRLRINHCRLIDHVDQTDISWYQSDAVRPWTMLVGANGTGKSTLLQAIALAAAGPSEADELLKHSAALVDERDPRTVSIEAEFMLPDGRQVASHVQIEPDSRGYHGASWFGSLDDACEHTGQDVLKQLRSSQQGGEDRLHAMVIGLGVTRQVPPAGPTPDVPVERCMGSLFGRPTHATNLVDRLDVETDERAAPLVIAEYLDEVIAGKQLLPRVRRIIRRGRGGLKDAAQWRSGRKITFQPGTNEATIDIPASWLSQGYQSVFAIAADILGNAFIEAGRPVRPDEIESLILIDELDLHVHPRWQVDLVSSLRAIFAKSQFVATTHAPLLLASLAPDEIFRLESDDATGSVRVVGAPSDPRLATSTELYRDFYDIGDVYPDPAGAALEEYVMLATDPYRTDEEQSSLNAAAGQLSAAHVPLPFEPVDREASAQ